MAAVTAQRGLARRPGMVTLAPAVRFLSRLAKPVRAPLVNLASIPLHVAGLGCIDAAAFTGNVIAGLVVTGLSLIWLEHVIADET
jgi:hypothetical protein